MNKHLLLIVIATAGPLCRAQDLNGNFIADSREIREGASPDCNRNGFIDARDFGVPHFGHAVEHLNGLQAFQNNVWDVCPIDFNADGRMDLALAVFTGTNIGTIALWRNEGGPGLVFHTEIAFPDARPTILKCADLNGDQHADLVAADSSFNRVYVMLWTAPGVFAPPVTLPGEPSNNGSVGLALGDLDNDQDIDIAWTSWGTNKVNIFLNLGNGTFGPVASYPVSFQPRDVAIGDFTGDGFADLAVANEFYNGVPASASGTVSLLRNLGNGAFTPHAAITMPLGGPPYFYQARPQAVELCDIDHDGDRDLITSSKLSNTLTIHRNDGAAGFTLAQTLGAMWLESEGRDVLVRDLDGDGWEDLAWGDVSQHSVRLFRNNAGVFEFHQDFAPANWAGLYLAAADYSGDGRPDLITANDSGRTFSILVNQGGMDFAAPIHLRPDQYASDYTLADFDHDGKTDLVAVRSNSAGTSYTLGMYRGLGNAVFSKTPIDTPLTLTPSLFLALDINHDPYPDILDVGGHCFAYLGNGDGTFAPPINSGLIVAALRIAPADYNQDGHLDLAWIWPGHPSMLRVSLGDGAGHFGPYTEYTDVAEDESVAAGDITGDGFPEFFSGHRQGVFCIHTNNGDGTFGVRRDIAITATPLNPAIGAIAVADFDGDQDRDVVISALGLRLFVNPGTGNLPEPPTAVNPSGASMLTVSDIDLDGDLDLFGRAAGAIVYLNNGAGAFGTTMFLQNLDSNGRTMAVADADNDGRPDVLIGPENSWGQYLYLNHPPVSQDANANGIPDECENLCYANCDGSTNAPILNVLDFSCFLNAFAAGSAYANCDGSTNAPILNVMDFSCFLNRFAAGCP